MANSCGAKPPKLLNGLRQFGTNTLQMQLENHWHVNYGSVLSLILRIAFLQRVLPLRFLLQKVYFLWFGYW
jgi:hypothetical protein